MEQQRQIINSIADVAHFLQSFTRTPHYIVCGVQAAQESDNEEKKKSDDPDMCPCGKQGHKGKRDVHML
jgi:hypothetical protein